jgi:aldehyde:ferredoxin oxidoreductase
MGNFRGADKISGEKIKRILVNQKRFCYACPIRCKRVVSYKGD